MSAAGQTLIDASTNAQLSQTTEGTSHTRLPGLVHRLLEMVVNGDLRPYTRPHSSRMEGILVKTLRINLMSAPELVESAHQGGHWYENTYVTTNFVHLSRDRFGHVTEGFLRVFVTRERGIGGVLDSIDTINVSIDGTWLYTLRVEFDEDVDRRQLECREEDICRLRIEPMRPCSDMVRKKCEILVRRRLVQIFGIFHCGCWGTMDGSKVRL